MAGTVLYERDEHVATITYNRPDARNAINAELRQDLNAAWERFRDDEDAWIAYLPDARVLGLRAAGDEAVSLNLPPASAQCGYSASRSF